MGRYSKEPDNETKAAKARGTHLRIHFKQCREIGEAIKGRTIEKARKYLEAVLQFKEAIPFTKYTGGIGRHAVAKKYKTPGDKVSWPQKATRTFLDLLRNVESNAEAKGLEVPKCFITHVNCNQAPKMRRRTYRAHGRINAYMSSPAHVEMIAEEKIEEVAKEETKAAPRLSRKQLAQGKGAVPVGGGI
jgi:large subunit ribosomal protein L17e